MQNGLKIAKKAISAALTAALILTALPVNGISRVNAAERAAATVIKVYPGQASTFNDTNFDGFGEFQGWGTSLCWWANRLGYDEALTRKAADAFYSSNGLNMNIGRYNVGGGDDTGNPKAQIFGISKQAGVLDYNGGKMEITESGALKDSAYTASDADFGIVQGAKVGSFKYVGWVSQLGSAVGDGDSLHYTVNVSEAGDYTVKMVLFYSNKNERDVAIKVNNGTVYTVDKNTLFNGKIASNGTGENNNALYLATIRNVRLNNGANTIDVAGKDDWTMDFVKFLVVKTSDERAVSDTLHAPHIERSDSAIPGYCKDVTKITAGMDTSRFARVDETSGFAWNYDWTADKNQLAILKAAMEASGEDFIAEAFSNSPPYFMTNSGCSSGAANSNTDNLRKDCYKAFAAYMADVIVHWAEEGFVEFTSTTPMNEPFTDYWGANSPKQEGCHFDQGESESTIIEEFNAELQRQLKATTNQNVKKVLSNLIICGTDETSIDTAIESYKKLSRNAQNIIQRIDTHTYGGSKRAELCALAEREGKNLWMSEIDVGGMAGSNPGEMGAALCFAQRIIDDLNGLKSSAWIMWNAIDIHIDRDENRRSARYDAWESVEEMKKLKYDDGTVMYDPANAGYWGIAIADHNKKELILTRKYYAYGQFSRYIRPGYTILGTSDAANTLIAYDSQGKKVVIVAINTSGSQKTCKFDLSEFKTMGSTVQAYRTSGSTDSGESWASVTSDASIAADTADKSVTAVLPANSITTFIVEGTEYDLEQNYETVEKAIQAEIQAGFAPENDALMEANMGSVESVALNADMVTGSKPWNNGTKDIPKNVVDGSFTTYFDGVADGWVQLDLGTQENIAGIGYAPREGYEDRCVGASLYGSVDGQNWTKLYTISDVPPAKEFSKVYASKFSMPNNTSYRYIKYAVPEGDSGAACNVAELAVYRWKSGTNVAFKEAPKDLPGLVAYYKSQTEGNYYSKDSWTAFQTALATVENLLNSGSTDTAELNKARKELALAYLGLEQVTEPDPGPGTEIEPGSEQDYMSVEKEIFKDTEVPQDLQGVIEYYKNQTEGKTYTEASWTAYQTALAKADDLTGSTDTAEQNKVRRELALAYQGLEQVTDPGPGPEIEPGSDQDYESVEKEIFKDTEAPKDLQGVIEYYKNQTEGKTYTEASKTEFDNAMARAEGLTGSAETAEQNKARKELALAYQGLEQVTDPGPGPEIEPGSDQDYESVEKEIFKDTEAPKDLQGVIEYYRNQTEGKTYTNESSREFKRALAKAEALIDSTDTAKQNKARRELALAYQGLELVPVIPEDEDYESVEKEIFKDTEVPKDLQGCCDYYAEQTEGKTYTEASWTTYKTALANAENLIKSGSTDTAAQNKARRELALAYQGLEQVTDPGPGPEIEPGSDQDYMSVENEIFKDTEVPKDLQGVIEYYKNQTEGKTYTEASWTAYQAALAKADDLTGSTDTAEQNKARKELALAYQGLEQVTDPGPGPEIEPGSDQDYESVEKEIFKDTEVPKDLQGCCDYYAEQTKDKTYTEASWTAYQTALTNADNLIKSGSTDTAELNKARKALAEAYLGLKLETNPEKEAQTITCQKTFNKEFGIKPFKLNAKVKTGDGTLTYKSSGEKVATVDKDGKVTIKGTGSCVITITASETDNYKETTVQVTITVKPKKVTLKKMTPAKNSLKLTWIKDTKATGYEIECCLNKKFKSGVKKATVKKNKITSATIKGLKKDKKYYVRIRAYKTAKVGKKSTKLTGVWSKVVQSEKVK